MTTKERIVVRVLLLVAVLLAPGEWSKEIQNLANHINQERFEVK